MFYKQAMCVLFMPWWHLGLIPTQQANSFSMWLCNYSASFWSNPLDLNPFLFFFFINWRLKVFSWFRLKRKAFITSSWEACLWGIQVVDAKITSSALYPLMAPGVWVHMADRTYLILQLKLRFSISLYNFALFIYHFYKTFSYWG